MLRPVKNWAIYYLVRFNILIAGFIPSRLVTQAGRLLGALAYWCAPRERDTARQQLAGAFRCSPTDRRARTLTRGVFNHLGQNAIELCRVLNSPTKAPQVLIPKKTRQVLDDALASDRGVIYVTGHLGNWELMAQALAGAGFPIATVAKASYDSRFTGLILSFRRRGRVQSILRGAPGASAKMLRVLKKGGVLGLLIDQDTDVPSAFVPFFNRPAYTPVGAAVLALRSRAEVVIGAIHRSAAGQHILCVEPCGLPDDVHQATALLTARLEERIRRHPSQWVWFHRRWKTKPVNGAAG